MNVVYFDIKMSEIIILVPIHRRQGEGGVVGVVQRGRVHAMRKLEKSAKGSTLFIFPFFLERKRMVSKFERVDSKKILKRRVHFLSLKGMRKFLSAPSPFHRTLILMSLLLQEELGDNILFLSFVLLGNFSNFGNFFIFCYM